MTFAARLAAGSPIATPTWSQFKAIAYGPQVAAVAAALGHPEIPPEGRSSVFQSPFISITRGESYFVIHRGTESRVLNTPADVVEATHCRGSGPTNQALRTWLRWWGWEPPSKAAPTPEPTHKTRTII